jgi:G3E family GTPase
LTRTVDPFASRLPVTVVTGFLGSGKTTLINRLLARAELADTAVIVNEFGEVGLDHELIRFASEKMLLLESGCVCCALRGDLEQALHDLHLARRSGEIPSFQRVLLETTGLADPGPVVQTLISDRTIESIYRLNGVVTLVDAVNARSQLEHQPEAVKQAAVADRHVFTKSDLVSAAELAAVRAAIAEINPGAAGTVALNGEVDPEFVLAAGIASRRPEAARVEQWLGVPADRQRAHAHAHPDVESFCLRFERPFTWAGLEHCLEVLRSLRGPDLLRVKGLVNVEGEPGPVVIQGVQHIFHPPVTLDAWPGEDHGSRIVFITRGIRRAVIENLFNAIAAAVA